MSTTPNRKFAGTTRKHARKVDDAYKAGKLEGLGKHGANGEGRPTRGALREDGSKALDLYRAIADAIVTGTAGKKSPDSLTKAEIVAIAEPRIQEIDPTYTRTATRVATFFLDLRYRAEGARDAAKGPRYGIGFGPDRDGEATAIVLPAGTKVAPTRAAANGEASPAAKPSRRAAKK